MRPSGPWSPPFWPAAPGPAARLPQGPLRLGWTQALAHPLAGCLPVGSAVRGEDGERYCRLAPTPLERLVGEGAPYEAGLLVGMDFEELLQDAWRQGRLTVAASVACWLPDVPEAGEAPGEPRHTQIDLLHLRREGRVWTVRLERPNPFFHEVLEPWERWWDLLSPEMEALSAPARRRALTRALLDSPLLISAPELALVAWASLPADPTLPLG